MIKYEDLLKMYTSEGETLRSYVLYYLLRNFDEYNDIIDCIKEIAENGCKSGCVSDLIYYYDTLAFYTRFKEEINNLLYQWCVDLNTFDLTKIFPEWDKTGPLAIETHNRNLLAWFGFEKAIFNLALDLGVEL